MAAISSSGKTSELHVNIIQYRRGGDDPVKKTKGATGVLPEPKSLRSTVILCVPTATICLLIWLDEGILATANFSGVWRTRFVDQISWFGPSYLFGHCAFQLPFGRICADFSMRPAYLFSLQLFEVASIGQAAAPSAKAFIVGRTLAGLGGGGALDGSSSIFPDEMPESRIPYVVGKFSWKHAVASIVGLSQEERSQTAT